MRIARAMTVGVALVITATAGSAFAKTKSAGASADPSHVVCKTILPTGSRMGERVCRTVGEWNRLQQRNADDMDAQKRNGSIGYDTGPRSGQL